jgi:DNA invertase Pin-like site-specific DNA recombinase
VLHRYVGYVSCPHLVRLVDRLAAQKVWVGLVLGMPLAGVPLRPGLRDALTFARQGDLLVVWELDRLSRSLSHLVETVQELERRGIGFRSLTEGLDTSNSGGKAIFPLFAAIASVERTLIQERTRAGLAAARQRGRIGGRPKLLTAEKFEAAMKLLANGIPPREVAGVLGVSIPTLYRHCPASQRTT